MSSYLKGGPVLKQPQLSPSVGIIHHGLLLAAGILAPLVACLHISSSTVVWETLCSSKQWCGSRYQTSCQISNRTFFFRSNIKQKVCPAQFFNLQTKSLVEFTFCLNTKNKNTVHQNINKFKSIFPSTFLEVLVPGLWQPAEEPP